MTKNKPLADSKAHGGIQSLSRAFRLLEAVANCPDGVSLTHLSRETGLHSSTVFHLLKTMMGLGYLDQSQDSKRYFIGARMFCLASSARSEVRLVKLADPVLRELAIQTGNSTLFGMRSGDDMVVVAKAEGSGAFQSSDRVGGTRPSHCTGMGKIMLASMPREQLERYLASCELKPFTPNTITDRARLLESIEQVRRSGLAFDDAEFHAELRCVAAPVRDFTDRLIGSVAMSGPAWRLSLQALQAQATLLREAASRLSAQFGHQTSSESARQRGIESVGGLQDSAVSVALD